MEARGGADRVVGDSEDRLVARGDGGGLDLGVVFAVGIGEAGDLLAHLLLEFRLGPGGFVGQPAAYWSGDKLCQTPLIFLWSS